MFRDNSQSGVGGFPATRQRDVYSYQKFYLAKAFLFCPQKLSLGRAASTTLSSSWLGTVNLIRSTQLAWGAKGANNHENLH